MSKSPGIGSRIEQLLPDWIRKRYVRKFLLVVVIVTALVLIAGLLAQSSYCRL